MPSNMFLLCKRENVLTFYQEGFLVIYSQVQNNET